MLGNLQRSKLKSQNVHSLKINTNNNCNEQQNTYKWKQKDNNQKLQNVILSLQ